MKNLNIQLPVIFVFLVISRFCLSDYKWKVVPNSPSAPSRFNDCSFINPNTGWVCSADNHSIYKTTDCGNNWFLVGATGQPNRCIVFFDSLNGWAGSYSGTNRFEKTTDGGITWQIYSIPGNSGTGLCGFSKVNDSVLYACGRYWGPARVIKTTNKGMNWTSIDLSSHTSGLVDCKFFTNDSGFVVGRATGGGISYGIVLFTSDGGGSWDTTYYTKNNRQWCWKIQFPTQDTGYISLQPASSNSYFLKTTDKGATWQEKLFLNGYFDEEGIGFINGNTGWLGGWENVVYETTNGGNNWHVLDTAGAGGHIYNVNRYFFFGDTLGFAMGKEIYKYSNNVITNVASNNSSLVRDFKIYQNFPNPFNPITTIRIDIPKAADVQINIYDLLGNEIATLVEGDYVPEGIHEFEWDASAFPSGVYYYKIYYNDTGYSKRMVLVK